MSNPTWAPLTQRLHEAINAEYSDGSVLVDDNHEHLDYCKDSNGCYWITAQVLVSPSDLDPNPNPIYSVWEAEDFSESRNWSDMSDWRLDEIFQCEDDDESGAEARRQAHDRAKYLRNGDTKGTNGYIYAVRPGNLPPSFAPAQAGDNS